MVTRTANYGLARREKPVLTADITKHVPSKVKRTKEGLDRRGSLMAAASVAVLIGTGVLILWAVKKLRKL